MNLNKLIAGLMIAEAGITLLVIGGLQTVVKVDERLPFWGAVAFVMFGSILFAVGSIMFGGEIYWERQRREKERLEKASGRDDFDNN